MARTLDIGQGAESILTAGTSGGDYQLSDYQTNSYIQTPEAKSVLYKYPVKQENCYKLDENLKLITDEIVAETKKVLANKGNTEYIKALQSRKRSYEVSFNQFNCIDKIEEDRLKESANLITKSSIGQEKSVLDESYNAQKIYIGLGALILITGLYIVLKK